MHTHITENLSYDVNGYKVHDKEFINELPDNYIFVFGSNTAGRHGAGAAKVARVKFGAVYGIGEGLVNQSYALPTLDNDLQQLPASVLFQTLHNFIECARINDHLTFVLTKVGCGLAGYDKPEEMYSDMLKGIDMYNPFPTNIIFPVDFIQP